MVGIVSVLNRVFTPRSRRVARLIDDATRRSPSRPDHHWVFDEFSAYSGPMAEGEHVFFVGDRMLVEVSGWPSPSARVDAAETPPVDEEYFEWIDILEAALNAHGAFTFLELGAGWGRWSARAACAARQLGKDFRLGLAEGDPKHVGFIHRNMAHNRIGPDLYRVYEAAISSGFGQTAFTVSDPNEDPDRWYGQSMVRSAVIENHPVVGEYFGRPKHQLRGGGSEVIPVPTIPLSAVLADFDFVDLADFDLQMAEREAIAEAIDPLTAKVRRLHIGTHSPEVEASLRATLSGAGWVCLRDYACGGVRDTAFGQSYFTDGVQSWINPTLI